MTSNAIVGMSVAAESIFQTLDEPLEAETGTVELRDVKGAVTFEHVSLRYPNADRDAVSDFNLKVKPGESIALVGFSGSGKTSVVNMIPRFWNPTAGRILIDGTDTKDVTLSSLRNQIAIVSQDVVLFDGTIRENIAYAMPDVTEEALARAIEAAALKEFIASLPQGLDTPVGEAGSRLSGGQKQRISIARAILRNTPILILDEATSALDSESEAAIKTALDRLMAGRTTFIVAHRLSTIRNASRIVVMSDGVIQEIGTHEELLEKGGAYANLSKLQSL
ncbi:ATP-binding cassette domain-containing protein [Sutterella seckii]|uniref:ATP-binding cassette domain-containing protein n=1 Tax=Sutterella seckii TaxID=1944635 RepID=A0A6I1ECN2_9BURK|nr:ATP-binding cassette domain-containing protein [Sutterella seckii]KAB7651002.1 ATP-binding cassette domain-containing protein [Sutterella seckii]